AGATMMACARSASATCSTASALCGSKRFESTGRPERVRNVRGPTNSRACSERQTVIEAPSRVSARSRWTALYAAIDPGTPGSRSRPARLMESSGLGRVALFLHPVFDLGRRDLLQSAARRLLVPALDARGGAAVELARALRGQHDEQIAVR